ncbi:MAG: hypothetical protein NT118_08470 [Lentisphaerae bacterium]|nr:hypothetical protein [Lentisphaerota bacterium]
MSERSASGFKIDDGSGVIVCVNAANNTVANGNHVSVKGTLNSVTRILKSRLITTY